MSNGNGHRWLKWYLQDHIDDPAVRSCCRAARHLWIELQGLMFRSEQIGYLLIG